MQCKGLEGMFHTENESNIEVANLQITMLVAVMHIAQGN